MPRPRALARPVVALATLALAVLLYPGALLRGEAFFERDLHLDWYPRLAALGRALAEGAWPLWEPGLGFGQPLLADPSVQVLYPVTWLALALPWGAAYTGLRARAPSAIAGLGAFRLAARLGAGRVGRAGPPRSRSSLSGPGAVGAQPVAPLRRHRLDALGAAGGRHCCVRRPRLARALGLAAALALQVLAGSADLCAMTLAARARARGVRASCERRRRRGPRRARSARCGCGPRARGCAHAARSGGPRPRSCRARPRRALPEDVRSAWSIPPLGLARVVRAARPCARAVRAGALDAALRPARRIRCSSPLYLGLPALGARVAGSARARAGADGRSASPRSRCWRWPSPWARTARSTARSPRSCPCCASSAIPRRPCSSPRSPTRAPRGARRSRARAGRAAGRLAVARLRCSWAPWRRALRQPAPGRAVLVARPRRRLRSWCWRFTARGSRPRSPRSRSRRSPLADLTAAHRALNATVPASCSSSRPRARRRAPQRDGRRVHVWDYHTLPGTARARCSAAATPTGPRSGRRARSACARLRRRSASCWSRPTATFFGLETSYDLDNRGLYPRDLNDLCYFLRASRARPSTRGCSGWARSRGSWRCTSAASRTSGSSARCRACWASRCASSPCPTRSRAPWLVGRTRIADGEAAFRALLDPSFDPRDEAIVASGPPLARRDGSRRLGPLAGASRRPAAARDDERAARAARARRRVRSRAGARASTARAAPCCAPTSPSAACRPGGAPRGRARLSSARRRAGPRGARRAAGRDRRRSGSWVAGARRRARLGAPAARRASRRASRAAAERQERRRRAGADGSSSRRGAARRARATWRWRAAAARRARRRRARSSRAPRRRAPRASSRLSASVRSSSRFAPGAAVAQRARRPSSATRGSGSRSA